MQVSITIVEEYEASTGDTYQIGRMNGAPRGFKPYSFRILYAADRGPTVKNDLTKDMAESLMAEAMRRDNFA